MPNLRDALLDRMTTIELVKIIKLEINFQTVEKEVPITLSGQLTYLSARELAIKAEGQRRWIWKKLLTTSDYPFQPDDDIVQNGTRYRVMSARPAENSGINEYHLVQDYQKGGVL